MEPWWGVANPTPWTGPPTETAAPTIEDEPLYVSEELKREYHGIPMYPWEGEAWSAPRIREIIEHGLTCADVNGRSDDRTRLKCPKRRRFNTFGTQSRT